MVYTELLLESVGCSTLRNRHDPRVVHEQVDQRMAPVESESLPSGAYRQTFQGEWGGSKLPCAFMALHLQRLEFRMS